MDRIASIVGVRTRRGERTERRGVQRSRLIAQSYRELPALDRAWLRRRAVVGGHVDPVMLVRRST